VVIVLADRISARVAVSVVFIVALFMAVIDTTIVNVALPTIGRSFDVPADHIDGVVVGFLVSMAVFVPASGWLGDRFGTRRVLLTAIAVFTVGSALCGVAQSYGELVVFRVVQGVGGGMLTPVGMAMLFRTFPPEERVRASSIITIPTSFAPALGPVLGGILVTSASWRWAFFVNVPIGLAGLVFGLLFLPEVTRVEAEAFDLPGFTLAGTGLGGRRCTPSPRARRAAGCHHRSSAAGSSASRSSPSSSGPSSAHTGRWSTSASWPTGCSASRQA
jgi:EmrB/QacA subfamily drug resistance transporter